MTEQQPRPIYHALDCSGIEYKRSAQIVGELPHFQVAAVLAEATASIENMIGLKASKNIQFGVPVFWSFAEFDLAKSKTHVLSKLLLTKGCDLSLDYCPSYN